MPGNKRWTANEIDMLRSDYGKASINHLSKKLGRSPDSIHWKASQLEIKYSPTTDLHLHNQLLRIERKLDDLLELYINVDKRINQMYETFWRMPRYSQFAWTDAEKKLLHEMYLNEAHIDEISQKLKRSVAAIHKQAKKMGLKRPRHKKHYELREKIIELRKSGIGPSSISKKLNVPYSAVNYIIHSAATTGMIFPKLKRGPKG